MPGVETRQDPPVFETQRKRAQVVQVLHHNISLLNTADEFRIVENEHRAIVGHEFQKRCRGSVHFQDVEAGAFVLHFELLSRDRCRSPCPCPRPCCHNPCPCPCCRSPCPSPCCCSLPPPCSSCCCCWQLCLPGSSLQHPCHRRSYPCPPSPPCPCPWASCKAGLQTHKPGGQGDDEEQARSVRAGTNAKLPREGQR